jgi:large subunit ribosomal protein L22
MESRTYLKNISNSPKKLRFYLPVIKKMSPESALDYLYYSPQRSAKVLYQALKSAITNAKHLLKVDEDLLEWKLFTVEEGQKLKRYKPGGRGTAKPYKVRFSHIKIVLGAKQAVIKQEKKVEPKKEVSTKSRSSSERANKNTK